MTKIQFKLDCLECRGDYQKADLTNYETDLGFCENEALIRDSHKKQITGWMQVTTWVPFLTLIATPAWVITSLAIPNSDICDRCMKSRGYEKSTPRSGEEFSQCMKNKGYEWKENKGAEEK